MKNTLIVLALAATVGCGGASAPRSMERVDRARADTSARVLDWGDLEPLSGKLVVVEGKFDHIRGEHGKLTLDSGLEIYIPDIHLILMGDPWFDHLGKRVVASGVLRTEACQIAGYRGPSLISLESFDVR